MTFAIGDTVGPYRIVDQIGQGGMATVYKAYHANLDRYVAFKVLHPAFKEDPTFLERFKREAQIVARLEHPSIVPVYDYADSGGQPYLVMKFIEGETLKARLRQQPLTLSEVLHIFDVVANALTYAHEHGILHRDIKPSNIMLDKNGTPYIADFGLARIAEAGESTLSQDMMLGTPQYISPEQAQGIRELGPSTDIYSLGVVLYEIIVGRVPFSADTPYAIVHDHIYKPLPLPSKVNPDVPLEIERVLLKALSKDPRDRYTSATEMMAAFRDAIDASGVTELSTVRYRPPAQPVLPSAVTAPPETISPPATPAYPVVPSPMIPSGSSSARRQAYRRRANLWILGGIGALLLICLASLFIMVGALSDPDLRPWDVSGAPATSEPSPPTLGILTVEQARQRVDEAPDDPVAHLFLALALAEAGEREAAFDSMVYAIDQLDAPGEVIAATARHAAQNNRDEVAARLFLEMLVQDDVPPHLRNEAGAYLFEKVVKDPLVMLGMANQFIGRRSPNAPAYTVRALALLQADRPLSRSEANDSIVMAIQLNDSWAEAYLVRGLYFQAVGRVQDARNDWQRALDFGDTPEWVVHEARRLLEETR